MSMSREGGPSIVVLGGGTGNHAVLSGLRQRSEQYPVDITALVSVADNGGSSGILRDEMGILPPGDLLKCLTALSNHPEDLRDFFNYRPVAGPAAGHPLGNLMLGAGQEKTGRMTDAVRIASRILNISGTVLPISEDSYNLELEASTGQLISGESTLDTGIIFDKQRPEIRLTPKAEITDESAKAIENADLLVIAPGSLYGSLGAILTVDGVAEVIRDARAPLAYVCNLVGEQGQTDGFDVNDYVAEIERFLRRQRPVDYVLYSTHTPNAELQKRYEAEGRSLVPFDVNRIAEASFDGIGANFTSEASFFRHDSSRIAGVLINMVLDPLFQANHVQRGRRAMVTQEVL